MACAAAMAWSAACVRLPCLLASVSGPCKGRGVVHSRQQAGPSCSIGGSNRKQVVASRVRNAGVVTNTSSLWGRALRNARRPREEAGRKPGVCRCVGDEDGGPKPARSYSLYDQASNLLTNMLNPGGSGNMPIAEGAVSDLFGRPLFFALYDWFMEHGPIYKLAFGPKAFVVISDPIVARHILRENTFGYDKGVLADILEPIMGKGLIPADLETWKGRRRAVVPAFHSAYLEAMVGVFGRCAQRTVDKLEGMLGNAGADGVRLDMEAEYSSLALDIIGISVFNYDFGSVTKESPIIQAVYGVLYEAEHRSTFYVPYWKFPPARWLVPRQVKFASDMAVINQTLTDLINQARDTRQEEDLEALQQRDYSKVKDASLLRFLVDMRGEDATNQQLRDDLMTMLIAGHETTAAVLTWATFMLAQNPAAVAKAQREVDRVLGDRQPTLQDIKQLDYIRLIVAESLRLYPQPPLLIRRSIQPDTLPGGHDGNPEGHEIPAGTDLFISVYNLHRSPHCWNDPDTFRPERFLEPHPGFEGWAGFDPERTPGALYPNETQSDFAYIPFGGGSRKCVGDQFAVMESVVGLAMLLRRYDIQLAGAPEDVQMQTGATIHTKDGLWCRLRKRAPGAAAKAEEPAAATA